MLDEQRTIDEAKGGDLRAFEKIYRHYAGMVYSVALRLTRQVEDAEEVTQDVFVTIHRKLSFFRGESSLKTWIYRITMNSTLNVIKRKRSLQRHELRLDEDFDVKDERLDPAELLERGESEKKVVALLDVLDADQKMCIILRVQEQLSYEEIAKVLNININTVRSRLKRAREKLLSYRQAEEKP